MSDWGYFIGWRAALLVMAAGLLPGAAGGQIRKDSSERVQRPGRTAAPVLDVVVHSLSRYVYRGYAYSEGTVHQVELNASQGALAFNSFANYDREVGRVNELLAGPSLTVERGPVSVELGYLFSWQDFENAYFESQVETTHEVYAGLVFGRLPLSPSAFGYYDFDEGQGTYYELAVEKTVSWKTTEVCAVGLVSYNDHYFLEESGWSHAEILLSSTTALGDDVTLEGMVRYSEPFATGERFGEIAFVDGGLGLESALAETLRMRFALSHALPLDDDYGDETWLQVSFSYTP